MELATPLKSPAGALVISRRVRGVHGVMVRHGGCGVRLADFVASGACLVSGVGPGGSSPHL